MPVPLPLVRAAAIHSFRLSWSKSQNTAVTRPPSGHTSPCCGKVEVPSIVTVKALDLPRFIAADDDDDDDDDDAEALEVVLVSFVAVNVGVALAVGETEMAIVEEDES